jgi:hypothetical protein
MKILAIIAAIAISTSAAYADPVTVMAPKAPDSAKSRSQASASTTTRLLSCVAKKYGHQSKKGVGYELSDVHYAR